MVKECSRPDGSSVGNFLSNCRAVAADIFKAAETEWAILSVESKTLRETSWFLWIDAFTAGVL